MNPNSGAYPSPNTVMQDGLSKRELIIIEMAKAIVSGNDMQLLIARATRIHLPAGEYIAGMAVSVADALIEEMSK